MRDLIGVDDCGIGLFTDVPRRELLLFDKIAIYGLNYYIKSLYEGMYPKPPVAASFEWLAERDIVFEPDFPSKVEIQNDPELHSFWMNIVSRIIRIKEIDEKRETLFNSRDNTAESIRKVGKYALKLSEFQHELIHEFGSIRTRLISEYLRRKKGIDSCSIFPTFKGKIEPNCGLNRGDVIALVLEKFPIPDASVSLEKIMEFRNNPINIELKVSLHRFMHLVVRSRMNYDEVSVELDYLINQYANAMAIAKMKYSYGFLELVIPATAEFLENLLALKPSKAVNSILRIRKKRIDLFEAEQNAPGKDISLIIKARDKFGGMGK